MPRTLIAIGTILVAATIASGCSFERSTSTSVTSPTAPSAATPAPGGTPSGGTPQMTGMWVSNEVQLPSASSCGHFQYQITSQTATSISGTFTAQCGGGLNISGNASGQVSGTSVPLSISGVASMTGIPSCAFSLSGTGTIEDNGNTLRIPYSGTTCLGPVHGTEVLHRPQPAAQPAPAPEPTPAPAPAPAPPPPSIPGGFDLNQVRFVGGSPDIRGWAVTSEITSLVFGGGSIHIDHTRRGQWPSVDIGGALQEATIFIFENINGQWYGTGGERLRPGQTDKELGRPSDIATGWFYSSYWAPMTGYVPRPGEVVGFMVVAGSTRADSNAPVHERTGVVLIPFPSDNGGSYPPFLWRE
jgi:hypothetical protein